MSAREKFEISSGIATALFGGVNCFIVLGMDSPRLRTQDYLFVLLIWMILPLMVAIGSFFHVARQKAFGVVLLSIGGIFLAAAFFYIWLMVLGSWYFPLWRAIIEIMPSVMALLTMIACVVGVAKLRADEPRNLTSHSTGARNSAAFIRED
jgi:hypothetical protein